MKAQVRLAQEKQDNSSKKEDEEDPILAELKKRLGKEQCRMASAA